MRTAACPRSAAAALPGLDRSVADAKERMGIGHRGAGPFSPHGRTATAELAAQMLPLMEQLATGYDDHGSLVVESELAPVERESSGGRLIVYGLQIARDGAQRCPVLSEALELRMVQVAACVAAQDLPCEQGLAPQGHESAAIEIFGVNGPEPHGRQRPSSRPLHFLIAATALPWADHGPAAA